MTESFSSRLYGIWISEPRLTRIQLGRSSRTQSHTYSTPASASRSGVSGVSRRPGLSHPRGRLPVKARSFSRQAAISSASASALIQRLLVHAVPDELPSRREHGLGRARVGVDDAGVAAGRGGQAAGLDRGEHARQAGAHAVLGPTVVGHVRHGLAAVRRGADGARHGLVERPVLDVDDQVHHDPALPRLGQGGRIGGERVGDAGSRHEGSRGQ